MFENASFQYSADFTITWNEWWHPNTVLQWGCSVCGIG